MAIKIRINIGIIVQNNSIIWFCNKNRLIKLFLIIVIIIRKIIKVIKIKIVIVKSWKKIIMS